MSAAFKSMPPPGDLGRPRVDIDQYMSQPDAISHGDTSYVAAVDRHGNVFSATPSDSEFWGPVIPSLGFSPSGRGVQSRTDQHHPSSASPGKRPRLTPNPALLARDGVPLMAFGCPGGDAQVQGMLQTLLNLLDFEMHVQQAIEAPRMTSWNFPNSFHPHSYHPARMDVESRIGAEVTRELVELGHDVRPVAAFADTSSAVHVAAVNPANGVLLAGSDPRAEGSAVARVVDAETRVQAASGSE
jgi:gamma-glutamyltranspeptidase/glutathione hydrolase